jgi:hypothetical protein
MTYDWTQANHNCNHDPRQYEFLEVDGQEYTGGCPPARYRLIFFRCPMCEAEDDNGLVFLVRTRNLRLISAQNALEDTCRPS